MASTSTSTSDEKKTVTLKSEDGELFEVEEAVAVQAQSIKHVVEDGCADDIIPVPNVKSFTLSMVLEYCKMHRDDNQENKEKLEEFDTKFMDLDQEVLYHLTVAANYLNVKGLLDACCQKVADMIKGKTPEQIRETFKIKNDFTPEEEENIKRDNQWAFE